MKIEIVNDNGIKMPEEEVQDLMARGRHFSQLSPEELERLAILNEEASEVQKAASKIIRHGYYSYNPDLAGDDPSRVSMGIPNNRDDLEKELGDLLYAVLMMAEASDISYFSILNQVRRRPVKISQYLHHNSPFKFDKDQVCLCSILEMDPNDDSIRCGLCGHTPCAP